MPTEPEGDLEGSRNRRGTVAEAVGAGGRVEEAEPPAALSGSRDRKEGIRHHHSPQGLPT